MKHWRSIVILVYFAILLLLAPINLLSFDTYYYWDWSRHLALSYYDGSPMIAYIIKLSTLLFGDTLFALGFVGIASAALTSWIIYKTARLFLDKEASYVAMSLWLFSPLVTLDILKQTTYDTPLILFWALTLYYAIKFIKFQKTKELYFIGASIGLMMLSKYSGVVLVLSLFVFLLTTSYRYLFKTIHFYVVLLLAVLLFSPVILWNEQHDWQSFLYQLTTHELRSGVNPFVSAIKSFCCIFLLSLNFMLLPPMFYWLKKTNTVTSTQDAAASSDNSAHLSVIPAKAEIHPPNHSDIGLSMDPRLHGDDRLKDNGLIKRGATATAKRNNIPRLCLVICTIFICFYLFAATQDTIRIYWLTPYLVTSALLAGYCFQTFHYRKSTFLLIAVYAIASLGIVINNAYPLFKIPQKFIYYHLIQTINITYPQLPKTIITTGWLEARMLFFLKNKPQVYTLNCGSQQNQYELWSTEIVRKIKDKTLKEALYVDINNNINCIEKYFDRCIRLFPKPYHYKNKVHVIYTYKCTNQ